MVERFKATEPGWQTRMNEALRGEGLGASERGKEVFVGGRDQLFEKYFDLIRSPALDSSG